MDDGLLNTLPLPKRLALSYANSRSRDPILGLMALEQRLITIVTGGSEVMIAQIKLAWWRDRLSEDPANWPAGEPLLEHMQTFDCDLQKLVPMVDGFEGLLAENFGGKELTGFTRGMASAWGEIADAAGAKQMRAPVEQAATELALFDLSTRLTDESELALAHEHLGKQPWKRAALLRPMRPLAVLHALAIRARSKKESELLNGPATMLTAMRVGITGR